MPEGLLHLVFSPKGLSALPPRLGPGDRVVLMLGLAAAGYSVRWPSDVRVFVLSSEEAVILGVEVIDYRDLVALTVGCSQILSW